MIEENKYFVFDNSEVSWKYYLRFIGHLISVPFYRLILDMNYPIKVKRKRYYSSICAIFKNEAIYLREWIEYHRVIGIEHFYLYNNFSDDDYMDILKKYVDENIVTLIEWPVKQGQMSAYSDCVKKYSDETKWLVFVDLDEFIVPNIRDNINEILVKFEKRPIIIAYWKMFGTSGLIRRDTSRLIIEEFYLCWRKYTNIGKCFFNTAYDYSDNLFRNKTMHYRWARYRKINLPPVNFCNKICTLGINRVSRKLVPVQINHYFTKSYEEYVKKMARGDAFFEINPRDDAYFYEHEMKCQGIDYNIRRFIIKLKRQMRDNEI